MVLVVGLLIQLVVILPLKNIVLVEEDDNELSVWVDEKLVVDESAIKNIPRPIIVISPITMRAGIPREIALFEFAIIVRL